MSKLQVVGIRVETPEEAAQREWFAKQALESPEHLEEAARLLIGLITGLLGALFTVLAIADDPAPAYLRLIWLRVDGVIVVVALLASLLCALVVVVPRQWTSKPAQPATQIQTLEKILSHKSQWLARAVWTFGGGIVALGVALVAALLTI